MEVLMTDFDKVKQYYHEFNEDKRLVNDNSGKLEFEMTMRILQKYLPKSATILDLGGATGVYTFPLAERGYKMYLADLSERLIQIAKEKVKRTNHPNIKSCDVVNATNLAIYEDYKFDVVLLFGPLYHLLDETERQKCIQEVYRVLKNGGLVFASFIPYLSGSIAIIDRYFRHPEQVNLVNLQEVFKTGKFNNATNKGFQEGYYPSSNEIENLFSSNKFKKISLMSIRGIGYEKEDKLYQLEDEKMFNEIIKIIEKTADTKEIIETCGHAMYIGKKVGM